MDKRRTLDHKGLTEALNKKGGDMDRKQQEAWEIVQKLQTLSYWIDYYTDLEDYYQREVKNKTLDHMLTQDRIIRISEVDFFNMLNMFKEATQFIFKRELILREYQKSLDSKNLLESDPIFQKLHSLNTRIRVLEQDKSVMNQRNKELEREQDTMQGLLKEIENLNFTIKEKDLEISVYFHYYLGPKDATKAIKHEDNRTNRFHRGPNGRDPKTRGGRISIEQESRAIQCSKGSKL